MSIPVYATDSGWVTAVARSLGGLNLEPQVGLVRGPFYFICSAPLYM